MGPRRHIADHRCALVGMRDFSEYLDSQTAADLYAGPICTYTSCC